MWYTRAGKNIGQYVVILVSLTVMFVSINKPLFIIFLFNKTNRRTNFSKFIFVKNFYIFRAVSLPIIRSFPLYIRDWFISCKFNDSFQALPGWSCLKDVIKLAWNVPVSNVQWRSPDDGQRNCPKHVEFLDKNKFGKISASVGFIKKNFFKLHGHMNEKKNLLLFGA